MVLKVGICPHCDSRIFLRIELSDINPEKFPAPVYVLHKNGICDKISTFYVDSKLRISYSTKEKKEGAMKTLETIDKP
jgi:hypothetical protein